MPSQLKAMPSARSRQRFKSELAIVRRDLLVHSSHFSPASLGGGIIAAYAFLAKDAPKYLPGYGLCIGFTGVAILASIAYYVGVSREIRRRAQDAIPDVSEKDAFQFTYLA